MAGEEKSSAQRGYVHSPHSYAVSGKIMLAAICFLFTVVVLIVCLHVYARCFLLRRRRRQIHRRRLRSVARLHLQVVGVSDINASGAETVSTVPDRGLDAAALRSLPVFVFSSKTNGEERMECAVCLSEFEENEKGRALPKCKHTFHIDCIDMWFLSHSTCPLCRTSVRIDTSEPMTGAPVEVVVSDETPVVSDAVTGDRHSEPCLEAEDEKGSSSSVSFHTDPSSSRNSQKASGLEGMRVEVPVRRGGSFGGLEESSQGSSGPSDGQVVKSPGGGFLSLKRIWSRERMLSPRGLCCSPAPAPDIDLESGSEEPELRLHKSRV